MRRLLITLATISLFASTSGGSAQTAPSLAERRAIATFETTQYPALQKKIQQAAGFEVPIEVDWNSLALPGDVEYYAQDDYLLKTIFEPIEAAFTDITRDDMGKSALKAGLKKISIRYGEDGISASAYGERVKFDNGLLEVNFRPFTNAADVKDRTDAILKVLGASL